MTAPAEDGYVIRVEGSLTVTGSGENCTITGGWNNGNGGGIYVAKGGSVRLYNVSIRGNTAEGTGLGGGVYVDGEFFMSDGKITQNKAEVGGAVQVGSGTFTMEDSTIILNEANATGGVRIGSGGTFSISGGTIRENESNGYAACIWMKAVPSS